MISFPLSACGPSPARKFFGVGECGMPDRFSGMQELGALNERGG